MIDDEMIDDDEDEDDDEDDDDDDVSRIPNQAHIYGVRRFIIPHRPYEQYLGQHMLILYAQHQQQMGGDDVLESRPAVRVRIFFLLPIELPFANSR